MSSQSVARLTYGEPFMTASTRRSFRVIEGGRSRRSHARGLTHRPQAWLRITRLCLACILVLATSWTLVDHITHSRVESALARAEYASVTVFPGDSIWQIAQDHQVRGCTTAELVSHIIEVNGLDGGAIAPGMRIQVPVTG